MLLVRGLRRPRRQQHGARNNGCSFRHSVSPAPAAQGWSGPGANGCTAGPKSKQPCTKEDCCIKCQEAGWNEPGTGNPCAFSIWNPSASSCFYKTAGAVPFAKTGDTTCCPEGSIWCPSAPAGGQWKLLTEFSDEFPACTKPWSTCSAPNIAPLNATKWNTSVASWSPAWSWDPAQVKVIGPLPAAEVADPMTGEIPDYSGYAAISMAYDEHVRDGKKVYYKAGIMKSTVPAPGPICHPDPFIPV